MICFLQENHFKPKSICCVYISKKSRRQLRQHIKLPKKHHPLILTKHPKNNSYDMQICCHLFGLIRFKSPPILPKSIASSHEAAGSYETANCQPDSHHIYNTICWSKKQINFLIAKVKWCFHSLPLNKT